MKSSLFSSWSLPFVICAVLFLPRASSLFAQDAGVLDFLVATAGHGLGGKVIASTETCVITSDSAWSSSSTGSSSSSCIVACRNWNDASLNWRRNVCSSKDTPSHAVTTTASPNLFVSNDASGSVRAWTMDEGALLWDTPPFMVPHTQPRVWAASTVDSQSIVAATFTSAEQGHDMLTVYNAITGRSFGTVKASDVVVSGDSARWLYVLSHESKHATLKALVASVSDKTGQSVASKVSLVELTLVDHAVQVGSSLKLSGIDSFLVSSLEVQRMKDNDSHAIALDPKGLELVQFSLSTGAFHLADISQLHPLWTSMVSILPTPVPGMMRIMGRDNRYPTPRDTMALFRFDGVGNWDQWYGEQGEEETMFSAIAHCPKSNLVAAVKPGEVVAFHVKPTEIKTRDERLTRGERHRQLSPLIPVDVSGDLPFVSEDDAVTDYQVISCEVNSMTTLLTTARGTTIQQTISRNEEGEVSSRVVWVAEEGLSHVSDALLLDASHSAAVLEALSEEEEVEALKRLSFSARLQSQVNAISSFFRSTRSGDTDSRDLDFGFVKVATLLSQSAHRVWGMPTSGPSRGTIQWTVDLPHAAEWHALVHGTASLKTVAHGINGGTHSPEVLVLSSMPDSKMEWTCLDGTTGEVHSSGSSLLSSPVVQVMPLFGGFGMCRQIAVLMHKDKSISVIPHDENGKETVVEHIHSNKNGMYTHLVDRDSNSLYTFQIESEASSFVSKVVGHTAFPGEKIVKVAYPQRDEVVQAPCNIIGDDSLLLKYLNPHLAVIMTVAGEEDSSGPDELSLALSSMGSSAGKRKPLGASPPGETAASTETVAEDAPNLFVNVVDTVSGRVLYRTSHSNASPELHIPVTISENWVVYAFFNEKIRRTEVGVLTLYEGMIDKKGLTAFARPEQALSFSSLEARDTKPVVLTKTYVILKPVTAIGITSTRGGISPRHVIFASGDDKLMSAPLVMLEPRRPTGDLKDYEKEEGLVKYTPLFPLFTLWSPSYNQTVDSVKTILSTAAGLESQSLVLAYGGADIFFTRLSPSKGFDLLPEDFNRILLTMVVVGLLVAVGVVRDMGKKKQVKMAWS